MNITKKEFYQAAVEGKELWFWDDDDVRTAFKAIPYAYNESHKYKYKTYNTEHVNCSLEDPRNSPKPGNWCRFWDNNIKIFVDGELSEIVKDANCPYLMIFPNLESHICLKEFKNCKKISDRRPDFE
jgi:hypothetical protein